MRLAVIIPTIGRKAVAAQLLRHLEQQTRLPDEVIVSAPDESHVERQLSQAFPTSYLLGRKGLCAQRNYALESALGRFDVITFFDDDFVPGDDYLRIVATGFEEHPDWAVIHGKVLRDGVQGPGLDFTEGMAVLRSAGARHSIDRHVTNDLAAYGCNMSMRANQIGSLRFDERLPLYGWQEDFDFTSQLRRHGRIVRLSALVGVHLGVKSGRTSGLRFGYSQISNPIYLVKKRTMPAWFAARLMGRNIAANLVKSVRPEPYIDRRGRLKGNLLAAFHVMQGRIEPEHVLKL
ncbi:MAG: glycosyltransferase [Hyphomonadaceae bacterium]|jgi:GT2 family glycosyltransferase|nr:glycosyltransferase [Hyphomonadaceae bacterium]